MKAKPFNNPDEYLALQLPEHRAALLQIREAIRKGAPKAEELISYMMPAFRDHGMVAFYAACKKHYGLYIPAPLAPFEKELAPYEVSKATIKLPLDKPIPVKLITRLAKYVVERNRAHAMQKEAAKKSAGKKKTVVKN